MVTRQNKMIVHVRFVGLALCLVGLSVIDIVLAKPTKKTELNTRTHLYRTVSGNPRRGKLIFYSIYSQNSLADCILSHKKGISGFNIFENNLTNKPVFEKCVKIGY